MFIVIRTGNENDCEAKTLLTKQRGQNPCELRMGVANSVCAVRLKHSLTVELREPLHLVELFAQIIGAIRVNGELAIDSRE